MNSQNLIYLFSFLHAMLGLSFYLFYGGSKVLPSHAFVLASVMFLGIPGFYGDYTNTLDIDTLRNISAVSFISLVVIILLIKYKSKNTRHKYKLRIQRFKVGKGANNRLKKLIYISTIFIITIYYLDYNDIYIGPLKERILNVSLILIFTWFVTSRFNRTLYFFNGIIFLSFLYLYIIENVDGTGRLILASLLFALLLIYSVFSNINLKIYSIPALLILIVIFSIQRSEGFNGLKNIFLQREGLQSVFAPYVTFGRVVEHFSNPTVSFLHGETYLSSLFAWFPRGLWESKPKGFGHELTMIFMPQLEDIGHSMVASYLGELFANGGYFLIPIGIIIIGITLRKFDLAWMNFVLNQKKNNYTILIIYAIIASGLFNFVWVGTYTLIGREGMKIIILFAIILFYKLLKILTKENYT